MSQTESVQLTRTLDEDGPWYGTVTFHGEDAFRPLFFESRLSEQQHRHALFLRTASLCELFQLSSSKLEDLDDLISSSSSLTDSQTSELDSEMSEFELDLHTHPSSPAPSFPSSYSTPATSFTTFDNNSNSETLLPLSIKFERDLDGNYSQVTITNLPPLLEVPSSSSPAPASTPVKNERKRKLRPEEDEDYLEEEEKENQRRNFRRRTIRKISASSTPSTTPPFLPFASSPSPSKRRTPTDPTPLRAHGICSACGAKDHQSSNSKKCPLYSRHIQHDELLLKEKEKIAAENRKASKRAWWARNKDKVKERRRLAMEAKEKTLADPS